MDAALEATLRIDPAFVDVFAHLATWWRASAAAGQGASGRTTIEVHDAPLAGRG